jgi:hypothetical protein
MKNSYLGISLIIMMLFSLGFIFIFYSDAVRSYFFESFKQGIERVGIFASWLDKYPSPLLFRIFGFLIWSFTFVIIFFVISKHQE